MPIDLATTNLILGIMAVVSVLEAFVIVGLGVGGWIAYRRVMELVNGLELRHVVPLRTKVDAILDDVKGVTLKVKAETERVDDAIRTTIDRVDDTADRVRGNVRLKTSRIIGFVRGLRVAIEDFLDPRASTVRAGSRETVDPNRRQPMADGYEHFDKSPEYQEGGGGSSFIIGLLTGTVLGAGLGMLFAPRAGSELRSKLSEQADRMASEGYRRASESAGQWAERGREVYNKASEAVAKGADEAQAICA